MSIMLFVMKDSSRIVIGECNSTEDKEYDIENYLELQFVQTGPQNMGLQDFSYPHPFIESLLNKNGQNKIITIKHSEAFIYNENEINEDTLSWYKAKRAKKNSGIILTNTMPKIING